MRRLATVLLVFVPLSTGLAQGQTPQTVAGQRVLRATGGTPVEQKMDAFTLGRWRDGDQLLWRDATPGDRLELAVPLQRPGRQHLAVVLTKAPDYGIVQFSLDGKKIGDRIDLFSPWVGATPPVPLGVHDLALGEHVLAVELLGANKESKGTLFGIDRIMLWPVRPPETAPADETPQLDNLYQLDRLPRLRPDERCRMSSSYDRTGGNNDGFGGVYSKLWIEDGNSVLAVMPRAGVIERIWFTHSEYQKPGLLNLKKEHLKVYLDGQPEPAIDVPLEDVFSGKLPQFPKPLVGEGLGGYYCYVPIPYRDGCKVVVEGTGVRFYQITYRTLPSTQGVRTFSMEMSPARREALAAAVRLWSNLGEVEALGLKDAQETTADLKMTTASDQPGPAPASPGSLMTLQSIKLPPGPRMIRAILLEGTPEQLKAAAGARIAFHWDPVQVPTSDAPTPFPSALLPGGDPIRRAAVDLPIEFFFCQAQDAPPYRSMLTGANRAGWYNFLPMPYRRSAELTISTGSALQAKLRVITTPIGGPVESLGYLHAAYNQSVPTQPDVYHPFLDRQGTGHYVGTYLVTEGQTDKKLPLWLEGDERFTVDGRLAIHGTGSEDYFNCGWYAVPGRLNGPGAMPLHGFPVYCLVGETNQAAAFRWHVADPVPYRSSLRAEIEHGADNKQPANYRSVGFFYELTP